MSIQSEKKKFIIAIFFLFLPILCNSYTRVLLLQRSQPKFFLSNNAITYNYIKVTYNAMLKESDQKRNLITFWTYIPINCTCMGRFDTSGTSKNDNLLKVLVGHGVKKYGIRIFFRGLQAEIWLFVYILWHFIKSLNRGIKTSKNNFWA